MINDHERLRASYLRPVPSRPASSARGIHHTALLSSDVERTIRFYQDILEFPLTELIENRDHKWEQLRSKLDKAGVAYLEESGASICFRDPDGARVELLADPLGEKHGSRVL